MDLEWNQSYSGHIGEHPRMPFEIIEIGAVKVDKNYRIIDEYSSLIKPRIYKKLHSKIRTILNYDETDLAKGRGFKEVCTEFLEWCGKDYIFCTWGPMDLTELQTNMAFYYMDKLPRPLKFLNLQQIYNIPEDEPFHSAVNDARYTALVLKEMHPRNLKDLYSFDLYIHPTKKEEEIVAIHNNQYEYITREFSSKQEAMDDKDIACIRCYKCNNSPSSYICAGKCWHHGYFSGKIKFKPLDNGKYYVVKTIKPIDKNGVEAIKQKQTEIRERRKEKRHTRATR